ncbi:hypothetical protein BC941DRAFT_502943 [Chlamydoabsidia padenii]|nr:hypothetical protein BC941DRAFT_502943 [Chlamydoabsidia padenii]
MASEVTVEPSVSSGRSSTTTSQRNSHKGNHKKNQQRKNKPPYKPAYLDIIQLDIDKLKKEARRTYEIQARQNAANETIELTEEEQAVLDNRLVTSKMIDKLEDLKVKLSSPEVIRRVNYDYSCLKQHYPININEHLETHGELVTLFQQETLTLLHFFYIVRLAQKGFFTFISQSYPDVNPDALVHLCDKLVGGSLFVVKDPVKAVRSSKNAEVFEMLHKLHNGTPEAIGDGYSTTFEQVQHLIHDFIGSSQSTRNNQDPSDPLDDDNADDKASGAADLLSSFTPTFDTTNQQPPVWLVVPFDGMVDGSKKTKGHDTPSGRKNNKSKEHSRRKNDNKVEQQPINEDTHSIISSVTHNTESTESDHIHQGGTKCVTNADTDNSLVATDVPTTNGTSTTDSLSKDQDYSAEATNSTPQITTNGTDGNSEGGKDSTTASSDTDNTNDQNARNEVASTGWGDAPTTTTTSSTWTQGVEDQQQSQQQTPEQHITSTTEDKNIGNEATSTGWGDAPTTTTTPSTWTQGMEDQQESQQQTDLQQGNGWGSLNDDNTKSPVWEGKLPDELIAPGDETINGDLADSKWQTVDFDGRRANSGGGGRGRPSGYRGGGHRPFNDSGRGGGGMRRGGPGGFHNSTGWGSRPNRPRPE